MGLTLPMLQGTGGDSTPMRLRNSMKRICDPNSLREVGMGWLWHVPIVIVLAIYLPAAILGGYVYKDKFSAEIVALLLVFTATYYLLFPRFGKFLLKPALQARLARLGGGVNWRFLAWAAAGLYGITLLIAALTAEHTPLGAALLGGSELDIARARAEFLATRQGPEALLRYSALILGKSVMPFIVLCLFYRESRWRYLALIALLCGLLLALEKSAAIFAVLPLLLFFIVRRNWRFVLANALALLSCIAAWTFLASGGLYKGHGTVYQSPPQVSIQVVKSDWPEFPSGGLHADAERMYLVNYFFERSDSLIAFNRVPKLTLMINRVVWIPYVTAYDWLRFQDEVLKGELTYGQQIGVLSWLLGKPRLQLEQMVYDFQLGQPQAGAGAANTIFLADAKLAFGWGGVVAYCVLFAFLAAVIFSSANEVAQISSVTSFYTAALSPLTATLLSGGLLFFLLMALFHSPVVAGKQSDVAAIGGDGSI